MRKSRKRSLEIQNFILNHVEAHPNSISALASEHFEISREAVLRHVHKLIDDGMLIAHGRTRDRWYELSLLVDEGFKVDLTSNIEEDKIWRHLLRPHLVGIPENVMRICEYGMNEMLNNAIEHSEGTELECFVEQTAVRISFEVTDNGVGIFDKITDELNLDEREQAILELSKGKLTTDPSRHTGEGIFFVSRVFDFFIVISKGLFYSLEDLGMDELPAIRGKGDGTTVMMRIDTRSRRSIQEVFDQYASEDLDYTFSKTDVPVALAKFGDESLVSRSQARRMLARFEHFNEIVLDFNGVELIAQPFADEVFRVFARRNPTIKITAVNTSKEVDRMIRRAERGLAG